MSYFSEGFTKDKLVLLYIIDKLDIELTKEQLTDFAVAYELIAYFELQSAVCELEESGFIAAVPRTFGQAYCLTPDGKATIDMFEERLPLSLRENIADYADRERKKLLLRTQYFTKHERNGTGGYDVTLKVLERDIELMSIVVSLPDIDTARQVMGSWTEKGNRVYRNVLSTILS